MKTPGDKKWNRKTQKAKGMGLGKKKNGGASIKAKLSVKSLKMKMLMFIIAIILGLSVTNMIVSISVSFGGITDVVKSDLEATGKLVNNLIVQNLDQMKVSIEASAQGGSLKSINSRVVTEYLSNQCTLYGYKDLEVISKEGVVTRSASGEHIGDSFAGMDYITKALNGQTTISTTEYDSNNALVIRVATPYDFGILVGTYDGSVLSNLIKDFKIGKTGNAFLLDSTGTLIGGNNADLVQERSNMIEKAKSDSSYASIGKMFQKITSGGTGIGKYEYMGVSRFCYYSPISGSDGWSLGVVAPIHETTTSIYAVVAGMSILLLVSIIAGCFMAFWFAGSIASPISAIADRMKLLSNGDLTSEVPVIKRKDEIGQLAEEIGNYVTSVRVYNNTIAASMDKIASGDFRRSQDMNFNGDYVVIQDAIMKAEDMLSKTMETFDEHDIQIAVLDIEMPGINGIEAAQEMRRRKSQCSIIFLTAFDDFSYAKKAIGIRVLDYLLKPCKGEELIGVLDEAMRLADKALLEEKGAEVQTIMEPVFRPSAELSAGDGQIRLHKVAEAIRQYMEENYVRDLSMQDVARVMNYSEAYFCKLFKQCFDKNFTTYLTECRVEAAKKLLTEPMVNVKEIGEAVGYNDSNYFAKVFKRVTGISPTEYRISIFNRK